MLLVNNGSFKSGSSWLGAIIRRLKRFHSPPDDYLDKHWENPHIPEARLASFLRTCDIGENDYYIKSHYAKPSSQSLLLGDPRVRVVLITRNLADVVVSAYFHFRRTAGTTDTFAEYFWTRGRLVANTVLRYDKLWAVSSPHVFRTTYAALQESPHEELRRLSAFILADADAAMIDAIIAETEFTAMKSRDASGHVRSGKSGAFAEHMDDKMLRELARIDSRGGLAPLERLLLRARALAMQARRRSYRTDSLSSRRR